VEIGDRGAFYRALAWALSASGAATVSRRCLTRDGRFCLLLHGVSSVDVPGAPAAARPHLTAEDLSRILDWTSRRFPLLTPDQFLSGELPGVLLTFDDGLANNHANALPVLRSFKAPALFFVSTQHVLDPTNWLGFVREQAGRGWSDRAQIPMAVAADWYDGMSVDQLRECASDPLVTIGAHSVTHAILTECSDEQLEKELVESRSFLESVVQDKVDQFAYPRGDYDARVMGAVERAGFAAAYVIDSANIGTARFEIPRIGVYRSDKGYLSLKMSGLHRRPLPLVGAPS
jgi:peptidoglycan/xylan/chitin deacetylase (PgdA/CDA1 family)